MATVESLAIEVAGLAAADDIGVPIDGNGSHRLVLSGDAGPFSDPDGFAREAASPVPAA
ncbi:hypothetical protein OG689_22555 [Kitasatospora sp. NBC_00240]|uniref:hypothetical protein n=1 Tax=Kitasatospora sp. NBC_00240 TaxID=2903567 RepID=UPI00224FD51E|nr:hypothetical protein [Kitasatospora sp. NBC_00240]MCX5212027.1 hypothetical protein [Kitasatospora sp. NBC_00240]